MVFQNSDTTPNSAETFTPNNSESHTLRRAFEAPAKRGRSSKSFPAAEAIGAFVGAESSQLDEIQNGLKEIKVSDSEQPCHA
jgi:hypothetical protein